MRSFDLKFAPTGSTEISASEIADRDAYKFLASNSPSILNMPASIDLLRSARVLPEDPKGVKVKVHTPVGEEIQQECFLPGDVIINN